MKVTAIVLLYKGHWNRERLRKRLYQCGVNNIVWVRNDLLNRGSAEGYTAGMKQVRDGFIWLLDDDNMPEIDALDEIKQAYHPFSVVMPYRPQHDNLYYCKGIFNVIGSWNACCGLNIFRPFFTRKNMKIVKNPYNHAKFTLPFAVYGGLFFPAFLLNTIGYPDKDYFLYVDDIEWTYRIRKLGWHIVPCYSAVIHEPDEPQREHYNMVKNLVKFQKSLSRSKLIFYLNCLIYMLIKPKRRKAVIEGMRE